MKIKIAALILSVIVAGGIVFQSIDQESPEENDNQNQTEIDLPEMKERYTTVQSPSNNTEITSAQIPIRFQVDTEAEQYQLRIDGEERKTGIVNSTNIVNVEIRPGKHYYSIQIAAENGTIVDSTRKRYFTYEPRVNISLEEPEGSIQSGKSVEFVYNVETEIQNNVELLLDGEIAAEDSVSSDKSFETTVEDIELGNHTWTVRSGGVTDSREFEVTESLPAGEINRFSVQNSDDGWNARVDVETPEESSYELLLNSEVVETGTVQSGASSLGIPINPIEGQNTAKILFQNSKGEFESNEETFSN